MPLATGQSLSFYEILGPLGAGGMGEVYRARDTRLEREVAIKVLPEHLAEDEERLRRFEREAKTLATVHHPNVAAIFGVDQVEEVCFLALELVPGEDLSTILSRGPLPIEDALEVGRQVAEGLEAAHEAGIVHRDLKPGNIRRTPQGDVKILDFGLAKGRESGGDTSQLESTLLTAEGLVLGTPTYMAPEQARGRPVDRRVDVWAFGCVLFESLSGQRAFGGASIPDVLSAVLEQEPDWNALPTRTPPRVRELVQRCLEKDPRQRLRDVGDARLELERALEERAWRSAEAQEQAAPRASFATVVIALFVGLAIGAFALRGVRTTTDTNERELRLSIDMRVPYQETFPRISPDGRTVVHEGVLPEADEGRVGRALFRRDLDDFGERMLVGTENPVTFCFSPDGESLAVLVRPGGRGGELNLVRVPMAGEGPTVQLAVWPRQHREESGLAWTEGGKIVSGASPNHVLVFSFETGEVETIELERTLEHPANAVDVYRDLGDGRHVLGRTYYYGERGYMSALVAVDAETGREHVVVREADHGAHAPDGRLLFSRGDTLFWSEFDADALEPTGTPVALADGLRTVNAWRGAWFDVADDGTMIWLPGGRQGTRRYLAVLEPSGELTPFWPKRMLHDGTLAVSPDGTYATSIMVSQDGKRVEVWGTPTVEPNLAPVLVTAGTDYPVGFPLAGGEELVFLRWSTNRGGGVLRARIDSPEETTTLLADRPGEPDWDTMGLTADGRYVLVAQMDETGSQFYTFPVESTDAEELMPLVHLERHDFWPKFSPDGRWVSYVAREADRSVMVIQRFEDRLPTGPKLRVPSPDGELGWDYTWSEDPATGVNMLVRVENDRRSFTGIPVLDGEPASLGEARHLGSIAEGYVLEVAHLGDGRLLVVLQDPEEQEMDRISIVVGASTGD